MERTLLLKAALFASDISQTKLAEQVGIPQSYLSLHLRGRYNFSEVEKQRIAEALGREVHELFQD